MFKVAEEIMRVRELLKIYDLKLYRANTRNSPQYFYHTKQSMTPKHNIAWTRTVFVVLGHSFQKALSIWGDVISSTGTVNDTVVGFWNVLKKK